MDCSQKFQILSGKPKFYRKFRNFGNARLGADESWRCPEIRSGVALPVPNWEQRRSSIGREAAKILASAKSASENLDGVSFTDFKFKFDPGDLSE
jgi:hypothetical protein